MSAQDQTRLSSSSRESLQQKLTASLKELYPLALKADEQLERLSQENKGRFQTIFQTDSEFQATGNRFLPYLVELSEDIQALSDQEEALLTAPLNRILKKIQLMHRVLAQFHGLAHAEADG